MGSGVFWIQLDCPSILVLGPLPVPIRNRFDGSERRVRFRQTLVIFECQRYRAFRQSVAFFGRQKSVIASQGVAIRQSGIRQRIVWILDNRFLKKVSRLFEALISALVPMIASLQISLVRGAAFGVALGQLGLIRSGQLYAQLFG